MKIGLFGGSFNPIHNGHIMMARRAMEDFGLESVTLMVAADPPHKRIAGGVDAATRYALAAAGVAGERGLEASDLEIARGGKSYTYDTVCALKGLSPEAELYLIVGADMLLDLPKWHESKKLLQGLDVIAVPRPGVAPDLHGAKRLLETEFGARVHIAGFCGEDISSTDVRERVFAALPIERLVPPNVERMIYERALYQPEGIAAMQRKLRAKVGEERYAHCVGTMQSSIGLAERFGVDAQKARVAALLHDCAKLEPKAQLRLAEQRGLALDELDRANPSLLHDRLGAILARDDYNVSDPDVIRAIACHTLGSADMNDLDKIVYLADKIEPGRTYEDARTLRSMLDAAGLDATVLRCMDMALEARRRKGKPIKIQTVKAREALFLKMQMRYNDTGQSD